MVIKHSEDVPDAPVEMAGASDIQMRLLISEKDGAPNFIMRRFEIAPGGFSPYHTHNYEHEVYVLAGEGAVRTEESEHALRSGNVVFVQTNEKHQFQNKGNTAFIFLCSIPIVNA